MKLANPKEIFPIKNFEKLINIKPTIKNDKIIVGDFSYFSDVDFESHVTHLYDFSEDFLIIGKFCQIAKGVEFVMNGANHQMNALTTFPFYIFEGWNQNTPQSKEMPFKGNTIIGNDVWIGQNVTIMPGVNVGDGVIVGANSVISKDVPPYSIVVGNPGRVIKKRFDDELIELLLKLQWWNLPIKDINNLIPVLTNSNLEEMKNILKNKGVAYGT